MFLKKAQSILKQFVLSLNLAKANGCIAKYTMKFLKISIKEQSIVKSLYNLSYINFEKNYYSGKNEYTENCSPF